MEHFDDRIGPLALLTGTWVGTGSGVYPTIESFGYTEEITFADGGVKPFLVYTHRTRHADDGRPLHAEAGFVRWAGGAPELIIASPTGVTEVHTGTATIVDAGLDLEFRTITVAASPTAKPVTSVGRELHVRGDELTYELFMGAVGQPHQLHLTARLHRAPSANR